MAKQEPHPNSIAAKAAKDPKLQAKLDAGRRKAKGDASAMERFADRENTPLDPNHVAGDVS